MNARKMFKELGWTCLKGEYGITYTLKDANNGHWDRKIAFHENLVEVFCIDKEGDWYQDALDMEELKAVNQQCKELGWL